MTTTLYIVEQARYASDIAGCLIDPATETTLHAHMSSSRGWLEADLTRNFGRADELAAKYPSGYEVTYVSLDDPLPPEIAHLFGDGAES